MLMKSIFTATAVAARLLSTKPPEAHRYCSQVNTHLVLRQEELEAFDCIVKVGARQLFYGESGERVSLKRLRASDEKRKRQWEEMVSSNVHSLLLDHTSVK